MGYPPPRPQPQIPDDTQLPVGMMNSPLPALMTRPTTYSSPESFGKYQDLAMRLAGTPPQQQQRPVMRLPPLPPAVQSQGQTTTTSPGIGSYLGTGLQAYQAGENLGLFGNDPSQAAVNAEASARDTSGTNQQIDSELSQMPNPADNPSYLGSIGAAGAGAGAVAAGAAGGAAIPAGTVSVSELGALGGGASADVAGGAATGALAAAPFALGGLIAAAGMGVAEHGADKYLGWVDRTRGNFMAAHPNAQGEYGNWSPEDQRAWYDYVRSDAGKFEGWFPLIPHSANNNSEQRQRSRD